MQRKNTQIQESKVKQSIMYLYPFQLCWQTPSFRHDVAEHLEFDHGPAAADEPHDSHERTYVTSTPTNEDEFVLTSTGSLLTTFLVTQPPFKHPA